MIASSVGVSAVELMQRNSAAPEIGRLAKMADPFPGLAAATRALRSPARRWSRSAP